MECESLTTRQRTEVSLHYNWPLRPERSRAVMEEQSARICISLWAVHCPTACRIAPMRTERFQIKATTDSNISSPGNQGVVRLAVWPCLVCIVDEFMSPPGAPHCSTVPRPPGVISEELASCITSTSQLPPSLISSEFLQSSISLLVIFQNW